jgi:hypothetical protein
MVPTGSAIRPWPSGKIMAAARVRPQGPRFGAGYFFLGVEARISGRDQDRGRQRKPPPAGGSRDLSFGHAGAVGASDWGTSVTARGGDWGVQRGQNERASANFDKTEALSVGAGAACALRFGKDTSHLRINRHAVLI